MLSRSFHNARHAVESLGISRDEAVLKYSEWMTDKEVELIKKMEGKTMKNVTRKTIGSGNNARFVNMKSYEYGKGIKVKSISRKAPKVSDFKVFKLVKGNDVWVFRVISNTEVEITTSSGLISVRATSVARHWYKGLVESGFKRADEKPEKKPAKPCKTKEESKKQTSKKSKKTDSKKPAKKAKKETAKKASKKETKKETTKKAEPKKPNKVGVKETPRVFILDKWEGNKLTQYQFVINEANAKVHKTVSTMKVSRGFVIADKNLECKSGEMTVEKARRMYKALKAEGFVA